MVLMSAVGPFENPAIEPVADDAASLALDLLVRELGYRRGAVNPFLVGY